MKPLLKWAGGKRWLVPTLQQIWPHHSDRKLVEPFTGGMAVALGLKPEQALLNDVNQHLINFYKQVKRGLKVSFPLHNEEEFYYEMRTKFNEMINKRRYLNKEAASTFYFLMRTGFNGLCRFNNSGGFNVPFGQHKTINYQQDFLSHKKVLQGWEFCSCDFEQLELEGDEFIYADPPYDVDFTKYYTQDFNWEDQERLAVWLSEHPGPVVASNQATPRILKLYKSLGFKVRTLLAPRRIACNGGREPAKEMLAVQGL